MGSSKLLKSLIKYLPKYIMFLRRMKIIIPLRLARGYHVIRKLAKDFFIWGGQVKREVGGRVRVRRERLRVAVREVRSGQRTSANPNHPNAPTKTHTLTPTRPLRPLRRSAAAGARSATLTRTVFTFSAGIGENG
jgi:hypothetical protein